jgi:hypothetical protein
VERVRAFVAALAPAHGLGRTTNLTVADDGGNACVVTTSLGLGSGDWLPGLDLHLNSMLGETDLLVGPLEPGGRMASMMAPTLILDGVVEECSDGLVLVRPVFERDARHGEEVRDVRDVGSLPQLRLVQARGEGQGFLETLRENHEKFPSARAGFES